MAINWFEGGRRISYLFMSIVAIGGATYVVFTSEPAPTLASRGPTMPWFVLEDECEPPSYERYLWDYDWGSDKLGVKLCFMALNNGQIPYEVAPTPPEEIERRQRERTAEKAENAARATRGEPPIVKIPLPEMPWFYTGQEYDQRVQAYVNEAISDLTLTPELRQRIRDTRSSAHWRARGASLKEVFPWVAGICGAIWVLTLVIGWIIRGFAGIPSGRDFKPTKPGDN